jgi:hypothetical protein
MEVAIALFIVAPVCLAAWLFASVMEAALDIATKIRSRHHE